MITKIPNCIQAEDILQQCQPFIEEINQHPVYQSISTLSHLRIFIEHHVFAVWDFMCLLKELYLFRARNKCNYVDSLIILIVSVKKSAYF